MATLIEIRPLGFNFKLIAYGKIHKYYKTVDSDEGWEEGQEVNVEDWNRF